MAVIRVEKIKDYTIMSNYHLRNKNLSLKAKGLMSLMLSLPDEWDYTVDGLVKICKENITAINSALKELKDNGYLIVTKRYPDETETGRIEYEYYLYEQSQDLENQAIGEQPEEKQPLGNQPIENHPLINNTNKLNTNKQITKEEKTKGESTNRNIVVLGDSPEQEVFNYWNSNRITQHKELNEPTLKAIKKAVKEHGLEAVKTAIGRYGIVYHDKDYFWNYQWSLENFLTRKKGLTDFLDNGEKWTNYANWKAKTKKTTTIFDDLLKQEGEIL